MQQLQFCGGMCSCWMSAFAGRGLMSCLGFDRLKVKIRVSHLAYPDSNYSSCKIYLPGYGNVLARRKPMFGSFLLIYVSSRRWGYN